MHFINDTDRQSLQLNSLKKFYVQRDYFYTNITAF